MKLYEFFLAWRYLQGGVRRSTAHNKDSGGFLSLISFVAIGGIALGVWALIVVVSVMNGFQKEVRHNILGVVSHATVATLPHYRYGLTDWMTLRSQLLEGVVLAENHPLDNINSTKAKKDSPVIAAAPFIEGQGMISEEGRVRPVAVRGIDPTLEPTVADFVMQPIAGNLSNLQSGYYQAMIGTDLAAILGLKVGDSFTLLIPQGSFSPVGIVPRMRRFEVAGLFRSEMYEYDAGLVLINIHDAMTLYQKDSADGLRLRFHDVLTAKAHTKTMNRELPKGLYAKDWTASHANFFRAVEIEKRMMFLILSIIIAVAAFNVVNQQMMLIGEKTGDIAILRTLGTSRASVVRIFLLQGLFLGLSGIGLGLITGMITAWNVTAIVKAIEAVFQVKFLSPEVYQIPDIPSEVQLMDVLTTALVAFFVTILATIYPSYRASKIEPAEALRYE